MELLSKFSLLLLGVAVAVVLNAQISSAFLQHFSQLKNRRSLVTSEMQMMLDGVDHEDGMSKRATEVGRSFRIRTAQVHKSLTNDFHGRTITMFENELANVHDTGNGKALPLFLQEEMSDKEIVQKEAMFVKWMAENLFKDEFSKLVLFVKPKLLEFVYEYIRNGLPEFEAHIASVMKEGLNEKSYKSLSRMVVDLLNILEEHVHVNVDDAVFD